MPKTSKWQALLATAKTLGQTYCDMLEDVTKEGVDDISKMVETRYNAKMSDVELIIGIYRYQSSMRDQDFTPLDKEKLMRLFFMLYRQQDQSTIAMDNMTSQVIGLSDEGLENLEKLNEIMEQWKAADIDLAPTQEALQELKMAYIRKDYEDVKAGHQTIRKLVGKAMEGFGNEWPVLKEKAIEAIQLAIDHVKVMYQDGGLVDKDVHLQLKARMDTLSKDIAKTEETLGLKQKRGVASPAAYMRRTLAKVGNYRKLHPTEFTYNCPNEKCGWEGVLERKLPEEGKVINALDLHWSWKCPDCKTMVAYDITHPLYTGKFLFSELMWKDLAAGELGLEAMARYMQTSLENIIWTAEQLRLEIPPHVRKELKDYEQNYKSNANHDNKL